jgi:AraC-like DNA-binding protein
MLHLVQPSADLHGILEAGVIMRRAAGASISRFPAMPKAMITLSQQGPVAGPVIFHGVSMRPAMFEHHGPFEAVGWVLPLETAVRLTGPSTGPLVDTAVAWETIAGPAESARLGDDLARCGSPAERLQMLQESLRRVLRRSARREPPSIDALLRLCTAAAREGAQAHSCLGLSERQLERRCGALMGLTPKQLQRLTRFHTALASTVRLQRLPDAHAALTLGYYDQSHLAREARQLAGTPLRELLPVANATGAWWPLATQQLAGHR